MAGIVSGITIINAINPPEINLIFYWVGGFALFAFLTTLDPGNN